MIKSKYYICPNKKTNLFINKAFLVSQKQKYKILNKKKFFKKEIIDFIDNKKIDRFYIKKKFYENYLNWLSKTLRMSIKEIREEIFSSIKVKKRSKILFVGCGFGDEINFFSRKYGKSHKIFAQDISKNMIFESAKNVKDPNIKLCISNAEKLPYKKNFFDLVFHFGGFNQFKNKKKSIHEMHRVSKENGEIFIADEGMGPWLAKSEIYKALKINNSLWGAKPPISLVPTKSSEVSVRWIMKNNFYCVSFKKNSYLNKLNLNIKHKSPRGGSIKTRYENFYKKKLKI